ncbi:MAG: helix-turn-helix transcriptional regulator [bacterium]|nr:helix-turn-helix transcriptional regulator [bacterium]
MISSDVIRGYVDVLVLDSVLDGPSYGYAISKRIEEKSGGQYVIKETTLYSAMRRLEESGALESFAGGETQGRPRTYYRITPTGEDLYQAKCAEWHETREVIGRFVREEN